MLRRALIVVLAGLLTAGCGGGGTTPAHRTATATAEPPLELAGDGDLVSIGGGRSLYVLCEGRGAPTVVLEAGFGGGTHDWSVVQPEIARTTRTCAYDRAGLGSSVGLPGVHDARAEIADLQRLLAHAGLPAPYVLVGHSYGGLLARLFTKAHPDQVGGVVLVDAMGRAQTRRTLAVWPRNQFREVRRQQAQRVRDGVDLGAGEALAARIRSLGATRLAVITAGRHGNEWGDAPASLRRTLDALWTRMQGELAALAPGSLHVLARRSDHSVQGPDGQPQVVVRSVRAVVAAVRGRTRLASCRAVFRGDSGVRCER